MQLLVLLALLIPLLARAGIGNVSSVVDFNNQATQNISLTVTGTNTVFVACGGGSFVGATTVAANDGSAYTTLSSVGFNGNTAVQALLARENVTAGAKTIAITFSRPVYGHCRAFEWSGLGAINLASDVPISNSGNSATPSTGSTATLSSANMLIVTTAGGGGETNWNTGTTPASSGFSSVYWEPSTAYMPMSIDTKIVSVTTAQSAAWGNTSGSGTWGAVLVAIPLSNPVPVIVQHLLQLE